MPVSIRKVGSGKFQVRTPSGVKAKSTTKKKALAQRRLIQAVDKGWKPTGRKPKHESLCESRKMISILLGDDKVDVRPIDPRSELGKAILDMKEPLFEDAITRIVSA